MLGGNWNSSGPRRAPSAPAIRQNASTVSAQSLRRLSCVMRFGAFSAKVNVSGTCASHPVSSFSVGIR